MHDALISALREEAEWAEWNGWEVPLMLPAHLKQAADAIEELSAKVDSLQTFVDSISKLPDCNTCLKKNLCEFVPKHGEYCRINCPAWLGEPPKEE